MAPPTSMEERSPLETLRFPFRFSQSWACACSRRNRQWKQRQLLLPQWMLPGPSPQANSSCEGMKLAGWTRKEGLGVSAQSHHNRGGTGQVRASVSGCLCLALLGSYPLALVGLQGRHDSGAPCGSSPRQWGKVWSPPMTWRSPPSLPASRGSGKDDVHSCQPPPCDHSLPEELHIPEHSQKAGKAPRTESLPTHTGACGSTCGSGSLSWGLQGSSASVTLTKALLWEGEGEKKCKLKSERAHMCESAFPLTSQQLTALRAGLQPSLTTY